MRKLILVAAGVAMLTTTGLALARGFDGAKSVRSVAGTFTATAASNSQTRACTTADGKTIATTNATYTGTASGDPDLSGPITLRVRSTINTTDGLGVVDGSLRIAVSGGNTVARFDAVYDHILHMSDALADGIVKQFPDKFGAAVVSTTGRP